MRRRAARAPDKSPATRAPEAPCARRCASWTRTQLAAASSALAEAAPTAARDDAIRGAAEGLRATFERHGLKLSQRTAQQQPSDAVRLLCALVNGAVANGHGTAIEPAEARQWFKVVKAAKAEPTTKPARATTRQRGKR